MKDAVRDTEIEAIHVDGTPHLSISAHVVVQLGEELVTDTEQALLELAKNAFDADSPTCEITVEPNWELVPSDPAYGMLFPKTDDKEAGDNSASAQPVRVGRLRIRDKGTGLTERAVQDGWLRISASLKRAATGTKKIKTPRGRTPVGDKGLGRLATMKIGKVLRMKTAVEGQNFWRTVTFSWTHFTHDRTLEDVPVLIAEDYEESVDAPGTFIEILGLHERERWSDANHIEQHLVPNLSSLVNPFNTDDSFDITITIGRHTHELHSLDEAVLNLASAKFEFDWDGTRMTEQAWVAPSLFRGERGEENEKLFAELFSDEVRPQLLKWLSNDKKLRDKGLDISTSAPWLCAFSEVLDGEPFPRDRQYPGASDPGPFKATLYYFMFHQAVKQKLSQARVSEAALKAMSQVAIYRDGFRVRAQRDWLRLSEGTTSGSSFYGLRPANVIGFFAVTNEANAELIEKSDREGFVDNPPFRGFMVLGLRARDYANSLLETVRKSVRAFQKSRERDGEAEVSRRQLVYSVTSSKERAEEGLEKLQKELESTRRALLAAQERATRTVATNGTASPSFVETVSAVDEGIAKANQALRDVGAQVRTQTKASLLLAEMGAEDEDYASRLLDAAAVGLAARSLSHELHHYVRMLREGIARISHVNKQIKNSEIGEALRNLNSTARELGKTIATIDPLLPGARSMKENIDLVKFLTDYVDGRRALADKEGVEIRLVGIEAAGVQTVRFSRMRLLQVVENLFQNSLYWLRRGPLPSPCTRRITVRLSTLGFDWADSGPGIKPSIESSIFDPYVSDKPTSEASGLGLHVVSTFLELERCSIRLGTNKNTLGRRYEFLIDLSGACPGKVQQQFETFQ